MTGKSISDILKNSLVKIKTEKPIEVKAPDPIVVAEIVKPQPHPIRENKPKMLTNDTTTSNWISGRNRNAQGNWDGRIMKLKAFFNSIDLPTDEIRLSQCEVITDVQKFITSHLSYVKRYNGDITFEPYLLRLEKMKNILDA